MTIYENEVKHSCHNHALKPVNRETPYRCNGCQEIGWGLRFRCEGCNYDLHKDCALTTDFKSDISLYNSYAFKFHRRSFVGTTCNACGNAILGFVYNCSTYRVNLHPCCANLPSVLQSEGVELRLHKNVVSKCIRCGCRNLWGEEKGWSYQSRCKNYHIHVSCMKDLVKKEVEEKWNRYFSGDESSSNLGVNVCDVVNCESGSMGLWRSRSWKIAAVVLNVVISIVLGNPLGVINFFTCIFS
ncbi:hypothetical protein ACHQM5_021382 [Ranunculus cassubicifolius]